MVKLGVSSLGDDQGVASVTAGNSELPTKLFTLPAFSHLSRLSVWLQYQWVFSSGFV